ncbi:MAG: cytidylate kinase-like family protein [Deltaproteobacteria bacterium]|nr:cytidylate kinase-like family protein [Deltaproteobacteria bacterium]
MKVLTISYQLGSGEQELGRMIADRLGWALIDDQLIHWIAQDIGVKARDISRLDEKAPRFMTRLRSPVLAQLYVSHLKEAILSRVVSQNMVVLGRQTALVLRDEIPGWHVRLVAPLEHRVNRMSQAMDLDPDQIMEYMIEMEQHQQAFLSYFFGLDRATPDMYDLTINTSRTSLEVLAELLVAVVDHNFSRYYGASGQGNVVTVSRQVGGGESVFARALGEKLDIPVYDKRDIERSAIRQALPVGRRKGAGPKQSHVRGKDGFDQYLEMMDKVVRELGEKGDGVIVGRVANRILAKHPTAYHVRLVSEPSERIKEIMKAHWAKGIGSGRPLTGGDADHSAMTRLMSKSDWNDPFNFDMVVNTSSPDKPMADVVALAAFLRWTRGE